MIKKEQSKKNRKTSNRNVPCSMFHVQCYKGFSFLEMILAVFIFSVIILASVSIFARMFSVKNNIKKVQRNMEAGRVAMEIIGKNMRMSSGLEEYLNSDQDIYMYNNSQGLCIRYQFSGATLQVSQKTTDPNSPDCVPPGGYSTPIPIVEGMTGITGKFLITPTSVASGIIGRATISMNIDGGNNLQTSVSFRDYNGIIP